MSAVRVIVQCVMIASTYHFALIFAMHSAPLHLHLALEPLWAVCFLVIQSLRCGIATNYHHQHSPSCMVSPSTHCVVLLHLKVPYIMFLSCLKLRCCHHC